MQAFKQPSSSRVRMNVRHEGGCQTYMNAASAEFKNRERTRATT